MQGTVGPGHRPEACWKLAFGPGINLPGLGGLTGESSWWKDG